MGSWPVLGFQVAGFRCVSKRVQLAPGGALQRIQRGFHGVMKRDQMGGGVLCYVKRARARQLIRSEPPASAGGGGSEPIRI